MFSWVAVFGKGMETTQSRDAILNIYFQWLIKGAIFLRKIRGESRKSLKSIHVTLEFNKHMTDFKCSLVNRYKGIY